MPELSPCGVAVVSIDVSSRHGADMVRLRSWTADILGRLNDRKIAATIAFDGEADMAWMTELQSDEAGHELAILATEDWYSIDSRRIRFSQGLASQIAKTSAAGRSQTTLALPPGHLAEHLDLLVKHGITAVRTTRDGQRPACWRWWRRRASLHAAGAQPQPLRWGLWELDGSLELSVQGLRRVDRAISAAAAHGAVAQVVVNLAKLGCLGSTGWNQFDRMLERLAQLRDGRRIENLTAAALAASLTPARHATPARSILRPAA